MVTQPAKKTITVDEYHQMGEDGVFLENNRVELIEGEILEMAPIGDNHVSCVARIHYYLIQKYGNRFSVFSQSPVRLSNSTEPQPDLIVTKFAADFYKGRKIPISDVCFIVEVSDTTLHYDQKRKLPLYAQASIAEVWIVDIQKNRVMVYSHPQGIEFQTKAIYEYGQVAHSITTPEIELSLAEIVG